MFLTNREMLIENKTTEAASGIPRLHPSATTIPSIRPTPISTMQSSFVPAIFCWIMFIKKKIFRTIKYRKAEWCLFRRNNYMEQNMHWCSENKYRICQTSYGCPPKGWRSSESKWQSCSRIFSVNNIIIIFATLSDPLQPSNTTHRANRDSSQSHDFADF